MEMEKELEQFRQEAQRLKAGRQGGSLPFPEMLRAFAVRYAEHTLKAGGTVVEAAQKLGVSSPTLYEWRKGRAAGHRQQKPGEKSAALVPVRVGERSAQAAVVGLQQVVLVSPSGWRVEGLSAEGGNDLPKTRAFDRGDRGQARDRAASFGSFASKLIGLPYRAE